MNSVQAKYTPNAGKKPKHNARGFPAPQNIKTQLSNAMLRIKDFVVIDGLPLSLTFSIIRNAQRCKSKNLQFGKNLDPKYKL